MKFKINDKVTVVDLAWSRILNGAYAGGRVRRGWKGRMAQFRVVATGKIPVDGACTADTLIVSTDNDRSEIFVAIDNCDLIPSTADIDIQFISAGKNVTVQLSGQSKKAVLEAHLGR